MTQKQSLSFLGLAMLFCIAVAIFYYPKWTRQGTEATLSWDVSGYYMYLPALFIYHDLDQVAFGDSIIRKYYPTPDLQQVFHHYNSGNKVMKYSSGQAIAMLPFFLVGHAIAAITDHPSDGFSAPYQYAIGIGMLLYTLIGL